MKFLRKVLGLERKKGVEQTVPMAKAVAQETLTSAEPEEDSEPPKPVRTTFVPKIKTPEPEQRFLDRDVRIQASVGSLGKECEFAVNKVLLSGFSWLVEGRDQRNESSLADRIFEIEEVNRVMIRDSFVVVHTKSMDDDVWRQKAQEIGAMIRAHLDEGKPAVSDDIMKMIPPEDDFKDRVEKLIEDEINPGIAGHSGECVLNKVVGNTIYITMGGGCQGCSAAGQTLKYGIDKTFREQIPYLGAVVDTTDHAAGTNPYFSE